LDKTEIINKTIAFVKQTLANEPTGHDWYHINRVVKLSEKIAQKEGGDIFKIKLIALLHDISDYKLYKTEQEGIEKLNNFLDEIIDDEQLKNEIKSTISGISFKGGTNTQKLSLEGQIVQDADRIDAIGAIGIARAFAYGGNKNRAMHTPDQKPQTFKNQEEYKNNKGSTINHFYEKLFLLKDKLNTSSAIKIAEQRHQFMEDFLTQFFMEWEAEV